MKPEAQLRLLSTPAEMQQVVDIQPAIWASPPVEVMPVHALLATSRNGGQVLGALVNEELVGMTVGMPAWRDGERFLLSHMAGVHPAWQGSGIGTALKSRQRELARDAGYRSVRWTFDPLQRGNANFNFRLPGVRSNRYYVDYYGEMEDGINAGLPSDRLEAHWPVRARRSATSDQLTGASQLLLHCRDDGRPALDWNAAQSVTGIEIPDSLADLKRSDPSLALDWRLAVREALAGAFAEGFHATGFTMVEGRPVYVLQPPQPWFLYVLQCDDDTLYTGICVDVRRRLKQHESGKGAAYTAGRRPLRVLASWRYPARKQAMRAEAAFKKLSRPAKLERIGSGASWLEGVRQVL